MVAIAILISLTTRSQPQPDSPGEKALRTAEKLVQSFLLNEWETYLNLSYPGAVKYYGGKNGFLTHVSRARGNYKDSLQEGPETLKILQIENDILEWQCVVERTRTTIQNGRKAHIITYLVGQSKDDGSNWKFVDVAMNSVENLIYIMPDIFTNLAIPQRHTVYAAKDAIR